MLTLKYEVLLRLRAIELIAFREGRLITTQLMDWFGVSRQQASLDINRYNSEFTPDALTHNPAVKGYVPAPGFQPALTCWHINEYMELLARVREHPLQLTPADRVKLEPYLFSSEGE